MTETIIAVIPARMRSSRFFGKPLARILDRPMLEHVFRRTSLSPVLHETYIATCDEAIRSAGTKFGAPVIMTSDAHERCTERVAEAAREIPCEIVVEVQGDEPLLHPSMIGEVVAPLIEDSSLSCSNLMLRLDPGGKEWGDSDVVKVVYRQDLSAMYMSRAAIPSCHRNFLGPVAKQMGIIAFRKDCLLRYLELSPTPLERAESVDMLRLIENNIRVQMVFSEKDSMGVDTPKHLKKVEGLMAQDPIYLEYSASRANA